MLINIFAKNIFPQKYVCSKTYLLKNIFAKNIFAKKECIHFTREYKIKRNQQKV